MLLPTDGVMFDDIEFSIFVPATVPYHLLDGTLLEVRLGRHWRAAPDISMSEYVVERRFVSKPVQGFKYVVREDDFVPLTDLLADRLDRAAGLSPL